MNRHERRKASRGKKKEVVVSEVFTMTFKDGKSIRLDIDRMRIWAKANCELINFGIDFQYIEKLINDGTVTEEHVKNHTVYQGPKPILVCERNNGESDQIVDGNHTYVATYLMWMAACEQGLASESSPFPVPGYLLTKAQWRRFVI